MSVRSDLTLRTNLLDDLEKTSLFCILDQAKYSSYQGYLSLGRTVFICFLLVTLLYFFNQDIDELIVRPI